MEHAGHGGSAAAPVARKIIDAYFSQKKTTQPQPLDIEAHRGEKREP